MELKFRVRREPCSCRLCGRHDGHHWAWTCMLCRPAYGGRRHGPDAFAKIFAVTLPHHLWVRDAHHRNQAGRRARQLRRIA